MKEKSKVKIAILLMLVAAGLSALNVFENFQSGLRIFDIIAAIAALGALICLIRNYIKEYIQGKKE